jgi:hypothetical protein
MLDTNATFLIQEAMHAQPAFAAAAENRWPRHTLRRVGSGAALHWP